MIRLLRQPGPLGLPLVCLSEQPRVLERARREVGEHGRAHVIPAVKRLRALELERPDPLAAVGERDEHALAHGAVALRRGRVRRHEARALGVEELPRLVAGTIEDLGRVERARDRADRVHERLEERRLGLELVLGGLVPAALGHDQVEGEQAEEDGRDDQAAGGEPVVVEREPELRRRAPRAIVQATSRPRPAI